MEWLMKTAVCFNFPRGYRCHLNYAVLYLEFKKHTSLIVVNASDCNISILQQTSKSVETTFSNSFALF